MVILSETVQRKMYENIKERRITSSGVCFFNLEGESISKPGASGFRKLKRKMQTNPSYNPTSLFNFPYCLLRFVAMRLSKEQIHEIGEIITEKKKSICCKICAIISRVSK